jgi:hypothetical protein
MHNLSKLEFGILMSLLAIMAGVFSCKAVKDTRTAKAMGGEFAIVRDLSVPTVITHKPLKYIPTATPTPTPTEAPTVTPAPTEEPEQTYRVADENNSRHPFNTMSADGWVDELYEEGFRYYQIPQKYSDAGGCLPEVVQAYLWAQCKERGIDYYVALAIIERESWYTYTATGDSGNSKGYMQIYEKYHTDKMQAEGVEDLYEPYGNIRVGLSVIQKIMRKNPDADYHFILMSYNMGTSRAKELFAEGTYSSQYSRYIMRRAQEIEQELQEYK